MDLSAYEANYQPTAVATPTPKKKLSGLPGLAANFLPTIGGAIGAAGGTILAPVAGTAAGGAFGAGLGEYLRQKLTGEDQDGIDKGNIVQEGIFGAIPGVGKGLKAVSTAKKAAGGIKGAGGLRGVLTGGKLAKATGMVDELAGAGKATAQTTETAMQARKLETAVGAKGRASERFIGSSNGIKPGAKVGSQTLTAKRSTQLNEHINANIGAKPTDAADTILRRNEAFISNKAAELDSILDARNVPLERTDYRKVIAGIKKPTGLNLADNPTHMQLTTDLQGVTDVKGLEKFRREIDDIVNFSRSEASPDPTTERIALAWRKAIDKVVTSKIPESKEIKTALNRAFDTKTFIEPAARNPVGANVFGVKFGGRAKQGFDRAVGQGLGKMPDAMAIPAANTNSFLARTARAAIPQAGYRVAGMGAGIPFNGAVQQEQTDPGAGLEGTTAADLPAQEITPQTGSDSPFSGANIETNVQKILANGGTMKEVTEYLNIVKTMQALQPSGGKPMSSEAAKTLTNAKAGVQAIADFEASINNDPGAFNRTNLPGSGFLDDLTGGRVSGALGTSEINASSQQIVDVLARLRTGAAISKNEEARFKTYIPLPGDPPEVRQQKLGYLRDQFTEVANRVNNSPQIDSETALTR
jgi:hypothetical protein